MKLASEHKEMFDSILGHNDIPKSVFIEWLRTKWPINEAINKSAFLLIKFAT